MVSQSDVFYEIGISLDGPPELHDYIRGVRGNWDKCLETYRRLRALSKKYSNIHVHFNYTISGYNSGKFPKFLEALRAAGLSIKVEDVSISFAHMGAAFENIGKTSFMITDRSAALQDVEYILSQYSISRNINDFQIFRRLIKRIFLNLAKNRYLMDPDGVVIPCAALVLSCFIDALGNIYPCTIWPRCIGNLRDVNFDFDKLWYSNEAARVRKLIRKAKCWCKCWSGCESTQSILAALPTVLLYGIR
jgi:MoaA/NifB/PqqE/SkfB family radical SAM enzyme